MTLPEPVVSPAELNDFLAGAFPQAPRIYQVTEVTADGARLGLVIGAEHERPGGTVSGPTLMGLADAAAWLATLSRIGLEPLAVTSSLTIHFLAKPPMADLIADASLLRLGKRSSVTSVSLRSADHDTLVAHATVGYSIPT